MWNYLHDPANFTGGVATKGKGPKYPLSVMATGLGKSLDIAMLIWRLVDTYPGVRVLQLCHVKELVESNFLELTEFWPQAPAGVYAASMNQRDTRSQIVFAMINSVAKRAASFGKVDFLIIDEAHRMSDNDASLYGQFINALREVNPNLIVVGYTATDYRMKGGNLKDMGLFDDVVYDIGSGESFLWAIEQGYLILPIPTDAGFQVDDTGIGLSGGDYKNAAASAAMHEQNIIERAVDYSLKLAKEEGRKCAIAFAQSIDDADLIADMMTCKGYPTEAVHSKMTENRDEVLEAHKRGELWGVTNKDILTTGWNNPRLDLLIGLRLTRSTGLWVQIVGRTTRPIWLPGYDISTREGRWASINASGKVNARVLDFCGNTERLGPINYPNVPKRKGAGGGDQPVRKCEYDETTGTGCRPTTFHHSSVKVCPHCGYEFPKQTNLTTMASKQELVSKTNPLGLPESEPPPPKEYEVSGVHEMIITHHSGKSGKLDTLRVDYRCGMKRVSQWVGLAHPRNKWYGQEAAKWWKRHGGQNPVPTSIEAAVERSGELSKPKFIKYVSNRSFPEIEAYDFEGHRFEEIVELGVPTKTYEPEPDPLEKERDDAYKAGEYSMQAAGLGEGGYDYDDIPF